MRNHHLKLTRGLLAGICGALAFAGASPAAPRKAALCVGLGDACYPTIQMALDAAHDGDSIQLGVGTFVGGITITKSIKLVGVSAAASIIDGGGPVVTIGQPGAVDQPTVSISRVTITGGFNNSKPDSVVPSGGGVWIPEAAANAAGATVTISDSVVTGNRVTTGNPVPLCSLPSGELQLCAFASGGGIASSGVLTVTNTRITNNVAGASASSGSLASDAVGGGIRNYRRGTLVVKDTVVTGNRSAVSPPYGRFAEAGGIADDGVLTVEDSVVSENVADASTAVPSTFPFAVGQEAVGGGIRIRETPGASATISGTAISGNTVSSSNADGDVQATSGGIDEDGSLLITDSTIDNNVVTATAPPSSGFLAGAIAGGLEVQGAVTVRNTRISHNSLVGTSENGTANAAGAGVTSLSGTVVLERTVVTANSARSTGVGGLNIGGGVLNVVFGGGLPDLTMTDSVITANRLVASPGIAPSGGGLFTADVFTGDPLPFTMTHTVIEGNKPDQCFGCGP
jgi:hypothetical protein